MAYEDKHIDWSKVEVYGWDMTSVPDATGSSGKGKLYAQEYLSAIRERTDEVLLHYGINPDRPFCAPWREDNKPDVRLDKRRNLVRDFPKDETLNVFELVGRMEGIEAFREQVEKTAEILGIVPDDSSFTTTRPDAKPKKPRFELPRPAGYGADMQPYACEAQTFALMEAEGEPGRAYLISRGFNPDELLVHYGIGYTKNANRLPKFKVYEPHARGFITIPFFADAERSTVVYIMARTIPGNGETINKEWRPKDVGSPLYQEWLVREGLPVLYVVEGLLDTWAMEALSGKPCIGLGSTSMVGRLSSLLAYTKPDERPAKVILALDADEAGRKAADKLAADLDELKIPHGTLEWPDGCDACDVLKAKQVEGGGAE